MEFGLDKCKINGLEKRKWKKHDGYVLGNQQEKEADRRTIEAMEECENYLYLGVLQRKGIEHKRIKEVLMQKY
ncbi:hypothetical protein QE152_g790 [Popillia japonica]|uniref:Uncharacterized protein n=1 Tax=Popillia japonica TaxID=7064 RepID=A0AAW1N793_POPJA